MKVIFSELKFKLFVLGMVVSLGGDLFAYSTGTVNGLTWNYELVDGGCRLYGNNGYGYGVSYMTSTIPMDTKGRVIIPSSIDGYTVVGIGDDAFSWCSGITEVIIPDTVTYIGVRAFQECSSLRRLVIGRGVASIGNQAFQFVMNYTQGAAVEIVVRGGYISQTQGTIGARTGGVKILVSTQWSLPATWYGYSVSYFDPIPELPETVTAEDVELALDNSADLRLKSFIKNGTQYLSYRDWVDGVCGTDVFNRQEVKDSNFAWLSYALDADSLVAKAPSKDDFKVVALSAEDTWFDVSLALSGVVVGENAVADNLATVVGVEGSDVVDGIYSSAVVDCKSLVSKNGRINMSIRPSDQSVKSFFFRFKLFQ